MPSGGAAKPGRVRRIVGRLRAGARFAVGAPWRACRYPAFWQAPPGSLGTIISHAGIRPLAGDSFRMFSAPAAPGVKRLLKIFRPRHLEPGIHFLNGKW